MALTTCPECGGRVSEKVLACPGCGYPVASQQGATGWLNVIGGAAGTYITAQALVTIIVGCVIVIAFAAVMVALLWA
jgi:uncharacterized membrane protein YvbJ